MQKSQPQVQQAQGANPPVHQTVYGVIREMILYGELVPGQSVTIQGLVTMLDFGVTPVREAIRRLTAEGALTGTGTRRVLVPVLTVKQLEELTFARLSIEAELALRATGQMTSSDINALGKIDDALNVAIENGDVRGYLHNNYNFHRTLYAHARADILFAIADMLWLRAGPSLRVVCGRYGTENLPDKHAEAMSALRAADGEKVAAAVRDDILQGHSLIAKAIES